MKIKELNKEQRNAYAKLRLIEFYSTEKRTRNNKGIDEDLLKKINEYVEQRRKKRENIQVKRPKDLTYNLKIKDFSLLEKKVYNYLRNYEFKMKIKDPNFPTLLGDDFKTEMQKIVNYHKDIQELNKNYTDTYYPLPNFIRE
jgi:hypothetical protein